MAREPSHQTIEDREYEIYPMGTKNALKVLARLLKMVGEPLGLFADAFAGGEKASDVKSSIFDTKSTSIVNKNLPPDLFAKVAKHLASGLDEEQMLSVIDMLLVNVLVKAPGDAGTRKLTFEVDFQGRLKHLMLVIKAALEVNYADFFEGGGGIGAALARAQAASPTT